MSPSDTNQKVIALIEDEKIISQLLVKKLEGAGYAVQTADDGEKGVALVKASNPDVILLDMMLPRLDGFGVLEALYREKIIPRIPLIIISNSGQPIEVERAVELGARDYLIKVNFDPEDVVTKVAQIFNPAPEHGGRPARATNSPRHLAPRSAGATNNGLPDKTVAPDDAVGDRPAEQSRRILLIEDDLMLVQLLERKLLQQKKYDVHKAFDVLQARASLDQYGTDIILLDIVLPGTDGFTFLNELKGDPKWKHIPVIIMSNLGQQEEIKRGMESGAVDYVVKAHTNPQEIIEKIESIFKKT